MAALRTVHPYTDPGYRRVRSGRGFRYIDDHGKSAPAQAKRRARALVIPPAWEEVWIARAPHAHIQAVGVDAAGRLQYRYHPKWTARQDRDKFARMLALASALPQARGKVTADLRSDGLTRDRALATAVRLLDSVAPRIGSPRHERTTGSRGLITLRRRDATVDGDTVLLTFPAKSGIRARLEIDDADLAASITDFARGKPGARLLAWQRGRRRTSLHPQELNAHLRSLLGAPFTAKDFRTLRGTTMAAETLARIGTVDTEREAAESERLAVSTAAQVLGNTPAVARRSYIDPRVFERYREGTVLDLNVSSETGIRRLLSEDD